RSSRAVSVVPTAGLTFGQYTLTIDPAIIADRAGNHLAGPATITFIVGTAQVIAASPAPRSTADTPVTSLTLNFNTTIDPAVPQTSDFALVGQGPDGRFGTPDDVAVPIAALQFNAANTQLTLMLGHALRSDTYRLTAPANKLVDRFGRPLDGEFTGTLPTGNG